MDIHEFHGGLKTECLLQLALSAHAVNASISAGPLLLLPAVP